MNLSHSKNSNNIRHPKAYPNILHPKEILSFLAATLLNDLNKVNLGTMRMHAQHCKLMYRIQWQLKKKITICFLLKNQLKIS